MSIINPNTIRIDRFGNLRMSYPLNRIEQPDRIREYLRLDQFKKHNESFDNIGLYGSGKSKGEELDITSLDLNKNRVNSIKDIDKHFLEPIKKEPFIWKQK